MTLWDLIGALVRRWPIVLVGAVLTIFFGHLTAQDRAVYWTRTEVVFLAPSSMLYPNSLKTTSEDLIITAGIVAKEIDGPGKVTKFASTDANLVGEGLRRGWSVRLPDTGGQWAPNFATQTLVVEVVGPDPQQVQAQRQVLINRIATVLDRLQRSMGVAPNNDISTTVAPAPAVIDRVIGSRRRAVAMTGMLGVGSTLGLVVSLEAWRRRPRRDRVAQPAHEPDRPAVRV